MRTDKLPYGELYPKCRKEIDESAKRESIQRKLRRWLVDYLGFNFKKYKKGVYVDSHERPDVKAHRKQLLNRIYGDIFPYMPSYGRDGDEKDDAMSPTNHTHELPSKPLSELPYIIHVVVQDETSLESNDIPRSGWVHTVTGLGQLCPKKGRGQGVTVSAFACEAMGFLFLEKLKFGKNQEGFWDADDHYRHSEKAVTAFDNYFTEKGEVPGRNKGCFLFDQSTLHAKYASDALRAVCMVLKDGGKNQPYMRDTTYINRDGVVTFQEMSFVDVATGNKVTKGLVRVLQERGIVVRRSGAKYTVILPDNSERDVPGKCDVCKVVSGLYRDSTDTKYCCLTRTMHLQPDFLNQKPAVMEMIESRVYICLMLPKFHCELNYIEMIWATLKSKVRSKNVSVTKSSCSFDEMLTNLDQAIAELRENVSLFRKCARNTYRMMSIYHEGGDNIDASCAPWIARKFHAHRRVSRKQIEDTCAKWRKEKGLDDNVCGDL